MQHSADGLIALQEASRRSGISASTLTRLARAGELRAEMSGRSWTVAWPLPEQLVERVARHSRSRLRRAGAGTPPSGHEGALWRALERRDDNVAVALRIADRNALAVDRLTRILERS